jgi:hypothetical protein
MYVKVVRGSQSLGIHSCDLVKGEKHGQDTVLELIRLEKREQPDEIMPLKIAEIVLPRDGDTVYVENDYGSTIDTFRAGEELPTGNRAMEIGGPVVQDSDSERTRVFRGLPRGVGPSDLSVGPILPLLAPANPPRGES